MVRPELGAQDRATCYEFYIIDGCTKPNINALTLHSLTEKEKLNGSNFLDWHRNLRITLKYEGKFHYVISPLLDPPAAIGTPKQLNACKMEEGQSVSSCILKMKSYIHKLERLGHPMPHVIVVNTVPECFHYGKIRHWKRNCPSYLAELKQGKQTVTSTKPGLFMVKLFAISPNSWVFDTSCEIHICNIVKGMRSSKRREKGATVLHMGNGNQAEVKAIGTYFLNVPSGMKLCLEQCHYTSTITRGVIFVSRLRDAGLNLHLNIMFLHEMTFIDDFSRYGYVYLIKHKHEVFKTFVTFQREVENQNLAIRSWRRTKCLLIRMDCSWNQIIFFKNSLGAMRFLMRLAHTKQTKEPSSSSIILRDSKMVVEEVVPTNVFEQAQTENQENNVAPTTHILRSQNDILMMGNGIPMLEGVKASLKRCFAMKNSGWKTLREDPMIVKKYLSDVQSPTTYQERRRMRRVLYASAIRSIMYVMTYRRLDVSYALSMTSGFQFDPRKDH
ncbi:hypothetical protein Tco_0259961 [Tanacetum coccineum]